MILFYQQALITCTGDIYKSLSGENQPLADINNISLTWTLREFLCSKVLKYQSGRCT